jgi:DNA-binding response OmpR family regulator
MYPVGRVLVVGETAANRRALVSALRSRGHQAHGLAGGSPLLPALHALRPEVLVVEGALPEPDVAALKAARGTTAVRVLLVGKVGRSRATRVPADVHLPHLLEAAAMVEQVTQLLDGDAGSPVLVDGLVIDAGALRVVRDGAEVALTETERKLLWRLARTPGRAVSKGELMSSVWGYEGYGQNLVEVHLSSLRRRLEAHGPRVIFTERGLGYRLGA